MSDDCFEPICKTTKNEKVDFQFIDDDDVEHPLTKE